MIFIFNINLFSLKFNSIKQVQGYLSFFNFQCIFLLINFDNYLPKKKKEKKESKINVKIWLSEYYEGT